VSVEGWNKDYVAHFVGQVNSCRYIDIGKIEMTARPDVAGR